MKKISFFGMAIAICLLVASVLSGCGSEREKPSNVSQNPGQSLASRIVVDSEGDVYVVWQDDSDKPSNILYATKPSGGSWSQPVNLSGFDVYARQPSLAIDSADTLHVAWYGSPIFGEGADIFYASKPRDGDWSQAVNISQSDQVSSERTSLAVGPDDTLHLVYNQQAGNGPDIFYASKLEDGDWSAPVDITSDESISAEVSLATDRDGGLHLAWSAEHEGNWQIIYRSRAPDGQWSLPVNISNNQGESRSPTLAMDSHNNTHIVWHDDTASKGTWDLLYISVSAADEWQPMVNITEDTNGTAGFPALVIDSQDRLHLTFNYSWPSLKHNYDILYNTKPVGGKWSRAINVSDTNSQSGDSSVAVNPEGGVYISYSNEAPGNWDVFVAYLKN